MATITKRGSSWFAQIRRKGFKPRYKSFRLKSEAQHWARQQELAMGSCVGSSDQSRRLTFAELLERYKVEISARKRGAHSEQLRIGKIQRAPIASLLIQALTPAAVAAYRDDRLKVVTPSTVRRELVILHHVMEVASKEWDIHVAANPVGRISKPVVRDRRERRLQQHELTRIRTALGVCRNPDLSRVVEFALATGMRRSEILSLRWSDVNNETRVATVWQTKNGDSRTVPLSSNAMSILLESDRQEPKVFNLSADAVKNGWARLQKRARVEGLRFHDLRHEAISRFFERGLSVAEVSHISGHRDLRMLSRYTHLRAEDIATKMFDHI